MVKKCIAASAIVFLLALVCPLSAQKIYSNSIPLLRTEVKLLPATEAGIPSGENEDITFITSTNTAAAESPLVSKITAANKPVSDNAIESVTPVQLKYGVLLDIEVELVKNFALYRIIDEWYGTRYRFGGTSKKGIDCSAFVRSVYTALFGILLPRTAREQYRFTHRIAFADLHEGDLVFFNTRGGVSHVGIYLQNNKFVHAASSHGVMISDLDDSYWSKRLISAGRYDLPDVSIMLPMLYSQP